MKIDTAEDGHLILEEVYTGLELRTKKESLTIMMRDSGFEIYYEGKWYSLQKGILKKIFFCKNKEGESKEPTQREKI